MREPQLQHQFTIYQALYAIALDIAEAVEHRLELIIDELEGRDDQLDLPFIADPETSPDTRAF